MRAIRRALRVMGQSKENTEQNEQWQWKENGKIPPDQI